MTLKGVGEWEAFVIANGWRALASELASVVAQPVEEIERIRATGACTRLANPKGFAELFSLWHGRAPTDDEWPAPRKFQARGTYEWQPPEVALLATLVGQLGPEQIAEVLTARLRAKTGDPAARRNRNAVQVKMNVIGLQTTDVVGGLTTAEAAREIGSLAIVNQMIHKKQIPAVRCGRLWVIPYEAWEAWKAKRVFAPAGYVRLSTLREPLGIRSDKLSEYARMGLIPTAVRCNPYGTQGPSTQFGTWWIATEVADRMLADRRAGRSMPWHGKYTDNLRTSFKRWSERKHPATCAVCVEIWGIQGAPKTFEEFCACYVDLAQGAKRHLTRPWTPGLTIAEVAAMAARSVAHVRRAIANGALAVTTDKSRKYVSRTDVSRWRARKCPTGDSKRSWISLDTASRQYLFTRRELRAFIREGKLQSKTGAEGAMRGIVYVLRHQCGQLREKLGFTEEQAARRVGVTVERLRRLLADAQWRKAEGIPLAAVQTIIKRMKSRSGHTLKETAEALGTSVQWVTERIEDGTVRVGRARWDRRHIYLTGPMLERLRRALAEPGRRQSRLGDEWLRLSDAAQEAGVCSTTLIRWANAGELKRRKADTGWHYHRAAVRARARRYWQSVRFRRAVPPFWLRVEQGE